MPHGTATGTGRRHVVSVLLAVSVLAVCCVVMTEIDNSELISLIEERPVLWDRTLDVYKDRLKTKEAWYDICNTLDHDYENKTDADRKQFCKYLCTIIATFKQKPLIQYKIYMFTTGTVVEF